MAWLLDLLRRATNRNAFSRRIIFADGEEENAIAIVLQTLPE
jgi:hypothetical protein